MGFAGWIGFTGVADGVVIGGIVVSDAGSVVFDVAGVEGIDDNCVEGIGATGVEGIGATGVEGIGTTGVETIGATGVEGIGATGVETIGATGVEGIGATGVETIGATVAMAITGSDTLSSLSSSLSLTPALTICGGTFGSTACAARKSVGSGASSLSPQPSPFHSSTSGTSLGA